MVQDHNCSPSAVSYEHCLLAHFKIRPTSATVTAAISESSDLVDYLNERCLKDAPIASSLYSNNVVKMSTFKAESTFCFFLE